MYILRRTPLILILIGFWCSCDSTNLFEPMADQSSDKALLEEARVAIDKEDYTGALELIGEMAGDSNDKRVVWSSALLGQAGLGILDIATNIFESGQTVSGLDDFFNSLGEQVIFDTGATRTTRVAALEAAISLLQTAPDQGDPGIENLGCVLSGLLALPTISTAETTMTATTSNLSSITANVQGTGSTAAECPGIEEFETNLTTLSEVQQSISTIFATIDACPILDLSGSSLNNIETALNNLTNTADLGCQATPSCTAGDTACEALGLGCMSSLLSDTSGVAGDGSIATCEIVQNCLDGGCF